MIQDVVDTLLLMCVREVVYCRLLVILGAIGIPVIDSSLKLFVLCVIVIQDVVWCKIRIFEVPSI